MYLIILMRWLVLRAERPRRIRWS